MRFMIPMALCATLLAGAVNAQTPDPDAGFKSVERLGEANGQALACGAKDAAARARQLMLLHAPRTSRFGLAFEQSTQQGFLSQIKGGAPCPSAAEMSVRIESIALVLRQTLPEGG